MSRQCEHIKANGQQCRGAAIWGSDPPRCAAHRLDGGPRGVRLHPGHKLGRLRLKHGLYRQESGSEPLSLEEKVARCQLSQARLETLLEQADSERQALLYAQLLRSNLGKLLALLEEYEQTSGQHPDRLLEKAAGEPLAALEAEIKAGLQAARAGQKSSYPGTRQRSPRYWLVYEAIVDHIGNHYVSPTYKQLKKACGISSLNSVHYWLTKLEEDGLIIRRPGPRGIDLPDESEPQGDGCGVPDRCEGPDRCEVPDGCGVAPPDE